jgi:hypothetical protein
MRKVSGLLLLLIPAMAAAPLRAQTENDVWPAGVNGPKAWPHEIPNSYSHAPDWLYPEGGNPPPTDLFTRAKCPDGTSKVKIASTNSAKWETSRHHPPEYAFDDYTMTRWSSWDKTAKWIAADMGAARTVKRVYLVWETAYGKDYDIQVSNDSVAWNTGKQVRGGNGQADVIDLDAKGRYIQMMGVNGGTTYGYSLYEFTICAADAGTSVRPRGTGAAEAWGLVVNGGGLPQGLRAFDARGQRLPKGRSLAGARIFTLP